MGWIFHAIFMNEGRQALTAQGVVWDNLSRGEQWRAAWRLGPPELWGEVRQVRPAAFGLSLVFMGGTLLLGILRWRMALRVHGLELPLGRTAEISLVAQFFNSFMLGSTGGDLIKAYYAARETRHKKAEAVVTVVVDRLIGLWSMLLFAGVMLLFHLPLLMTHEALGVTAAVILAMLSGCSVVAVLAFWGGLSRRWPGTRHFLRRLPRGEWLEKLLESCREFGRAPGFLFKALGLSMLLNVVCVAQYWALGEGLGLKVSPSLYLLLVPMIICIAALPITPSGLGVRENLFVLLLSGPAIGAPSTTALSLSLLAYAGFLIWSLAGGVVYVTFRDKHHLHEITAEPTPEI